MNRQTPRGRKAYKKTVVLIVALVLAVVFYQKAPRVIESIVTVLDESKPAGGGTVGEFDEEHVDAIRQAVAGFWVYDYKGNPDSLHSSVSDRIELKDNGIIWRVRSEVYNLPDGAEIPVTHIYQAMLIPFMIADSGEQVTISDVQYLKQIWIVGEDTCYVPGHKVLAPMFQKNDTTEYIRVGMESWRHAVGDETLLLNDALYRPYSSDDLSNFFPPGAIDLVDDIAVRKCPESFSRSVALRMALVDAMEEVAAEDRDLEAVRMLLNSLYVPECLLPLLGAEHARRGPDAVAIDIAFAVEPDGRVSKVLAESSVFRFRPSTKKAVVNEVSAWRFSTVPDAKEEKVDYRFRF